MPTSTPPDLITPPLGAPWINTPASSIVLPGELPPTGLVASLDVTVVNHLATLNSTQNYRVMVSGRAAPVTVNLPDPGGLGQTVEIVDASQQADVFPITVNAGSKNILGFGATMTVSNPGAIVRLTYSGTGWI